MITTFRFRCLIVAGALLLNCALPLRADARPHADRITQQTNADPAKLIDSEDDLGSYAILGKNYSVVAHRKTIPHADHPEFATTISSLEIRELGVGVAFQENFLSEVAGGRFVPKLNVSASLLSGAANAAVVIRIVDEVSAARGDVTFQMFGVVGGKLAPFGAPVPLGQPGSNTAVGNVLTGVMVGGGVDIEPLMSTSEVLLFRTWTGNFLVDVPVRVDWAHGKWTEGEECYGLNNGGSPKRRGCNLQIASSAKPRVDGATVTIFAEPVEDRYNQQVLPVDNRVKVEVLGLQAVVAWKESGDRFTCAFTNVWLHVRIDGKEGWTQSAADFAALGFPAGNAPE